MRTETLAKTIAALHKLRRCVYIVGGVGIGKTSIPRQVAAEQGIGFVHFHAPTMQPEDLALPAPNTDRSGIEFLVNTRFPLEGNDCPDEGILLIDEAGQADNSIQKTLANLIQAREIHGRKVKEGWTIICTGNRQKDRAGVNRILSHLNDRWTTVELDASLDDWTGWAIANDIQPEVISFLRFKSSLFNAFDPNVDISPTPRSWAEGVSPVIGNVPHEAEYECLRGAVGEGAATEFLGYLKICRALPNPDVILQHPETHEVPKELSVLYALSGALAARANESNFNEVMAFSRRMPQEFCALVVIDSIKRDKGVQKTKGFIQWATTDGKSILV